MVCQRKFWKALNCCRTIALANLQSLIFWTFTPGGYSAACLRASWITRHTRSGVTGMSMWCTP